MEGVSFTVSRKFCILNNICLCVYVYIYIYLCVYIYTFSNVLNILPFPYFLVFVRLKIFDDVFFVQNSHLAEREKHKKKKVESDHQFCSSLFFFYFHDETNLGDPRGWQQESTKNRREITEGD